MVQSDQQNLSTSNFWRSICLFGVAVGVSYIGYRVYQQYKINSSEKKQTPKTPMENRIKTQYSDYYFDKNMQIQLLQDNLPQQPCLEDIYLSSPKISTDEFLKYTKQIRKRRRLIRKVNEEQYIDLILKYENELQQLLVRSRLQLIEYLVIDPEEFRKMEENYEIVEDLHTLHKKSQAILRQQLLQYGKPKRMSEQKLKGIIQDEIAFVRTKMYQRMKNKLQSEATLSQSEILAVVNALQEDIIYEKYGYEREDIETKIKEGLIDTRERNKCKAILEAEVVAFNYESLQSSEEYQEIEKSIPTLGVST